MTDSLDVMEAHFGVCPHCLDGHLLNVRKNLWGICETHQVRWFCGSGQVSSWRSETQAIWEENARRLSNCLDVEPFVLEVLDDLQLGGLGELGGSDREETSP